MRELTQSSLMPGNCWQTAVACVLDLDPEMLPSQARYDVAARSFSGWGGYQNVLNGYLAKHHRMMYAELYEYQIGAVMPREPGYHMLIGPTIRTAEHRAAGRHQVNHIVVARYGEMIWDPHPSRAGLTEIERWGVLGPLPERLHRMNIDRADKFAADGRDDAADYRRVMIDCLCPGCCADRGEP